MAEEAPDFVPTQAHFGVVRYIVDRGCRQIVSCHRVDKGARLLHSVALLLHEIPACSTLFEADDQYFGFGCFPRPFHLVICIAFCFLIVTFPFFAGFTVHGWFRAWLRQLLVCLIACFLAVPRVEREVLWFFFLAPG